MSIFETAEILNSLTKNDKHEYDIVLSHIKYQAHQYSNDFVGLPRDFVADYAFATTESQRFFNIKVRFTVKKRWFKERVFYSVINISEISSDQYLDILNTIKEYEEGEEEE